MAPRKNTTMAVEARDSSERGFSSESAFRERELTESS